MKELFLIRHGEKESQNNYEHDYDIPLTQKGLEDNTKLGKLLRSKNIMPDLVVSSPAIRARQSADLVAKEIKYKKSIMYNEVIYQAFLNELIESITYTFDSVNSLMLIGHNPALSALAITFTEFKEELKMADAIKIEFACNSWTQISKENASFCELYRL